MASTVPPTFKLERYFAKYEFSTKFLLCCSDVEALTMKELVAMADPECKELWDNLKLSYTTSEGHPLLRREVGVIHGVHEDQVLAIVPQEGIYIATHCIIDHIRRTSGLLKPHVITTFPAYQSLYQNTETLQCDVGYWTVTETENGWKFDLAKLKSMLRDDTKLLIVNFPHNPTGAMPTQDEFQAIVDLCKQHTIFLFSDEMYRLTNNDATKPLSSACQMYDDAISLSGVSKSFALPGLRVGWVCTKNSALLQMMQSFRDYTTICGSGPSEILALIALRSRERVLAKTMELLHKNLRVLNEFFQEFPELFTWCPPRASSTGLARVKGWLLKLGAGGASGFCSTLVQKAGVLLLPTSMYDFQDEFVRVSFGRADMPQALEALRTFIAENEPRT